MKNTVLVEKKIIGILRIAATILIFCSIGAIALLVVCGMINKQNLSGEITEVTGTITDVRYDGIPIVTIDSKSYNVVWDEENNIDMELYLNKQVTLVTPAKTFMSNAWVLGLTVDGETIVDYTDTLQYKIDDNRQMLIVSAILAGVFCVATCGVYIWKINVPPLVEKELYPKFSEYMIPRQPSCKQRKAIVICVLVYLWLILSLCVALAILSADAESISQFTPAALGVFITFLIVVVGGFVAIPIVVKWTAKKEVEFYAQNLPFDFSDISHAKLKKSVKEQLQAEILEEKRKNPDTYGDGGNGYDVTFEEKGVKLKAPVEEGMVGADVSDVFGVASDDNVYEGIGSPTDEKSFGMPYTELNFEAVACYRKNDHPMTIIVKSRIQRTDDFPEDFVNDLHFMLDSNLLATLKKFDVKVENLDYLLENKKSLMEEHCLRKRKKN